jgi:uncharacterized protein YkwD
MKTLLFQGNWVDLVIILVLIYFAADAWKTGFWIILADFVSFLLSLLIALSGFSLFANNLTYFFSLNRSIANALGFFIAAGLSEAVLGFVFTNIVTRIPYKFWKKPWNNIAGIIPALGQAFVIISFLLTLIVSLPVTPLVKRDVINSPIGGYLVQKTVGIEAQLKEIFGGLAEDALTYLTVKPGSTESIELTCDPLNLSVDDVSETEMLKMVNNERKRVGVKELILRPDLIPIARNHAKDMCERHYFGHVSPDGEDVGKRLEKSNITYRIAGENLAVAPTLKTAHTGLMNSEGHRRNILDPDFRRMGIGVLDDGIYGKIFVQIFTE